MPSPHIRAAEPDDAASIVSIFATPRTARGTSQHPYLTVAAWRRRIDSCPEQDTQLVAVIEGQVVGLISLARPANPRRAHSALLGMAVREDRHGQGIGTAMLTAILELADNWLGLVRIELTVWHDNEPTIRLYRRFGFVEEGVLRLNGLRDGVLTDCLAMARITLPAERLAARPRTD